MVYCNWSLSLPVVHHFIVSDSDTFLFRTFCFAINLFSGCPFIFLSLFPALYSFLASLFIFLISILMFVNFATFSPSANIIASPGTSIFLFVCLSPSSNLSKCFSDLLYPFDHCSFLSANSMLSATISVVYTFVPSVFV